MVRTLLILLVVVLLLPVLALLLLQTSPVKSKIVAIAEEQAGNYLNGTLRVGQLKGNFISHIALDDVLLLTPQNDTLLFVDYLALRYHLLPLLNKDIVVDEVSIENPFVFIEQFPDSTWNFSTLVKLTDTAPDTTESAPFSMRVSVKDFRFENGTIHLLTQNKNIPKEINNFSFRLSGLYSADEQALDLASFHFATRQPDVELRALELRFKRNLESMQLDALKLETAQNYLSADGSYTSKPVAKANLKVRMDTIALREFQAFLPEDVQLKVRPDLYLDGDWQANNLKLNLGLKTRNEGFDLKMVSENLIEALMDSTLTESVVYELDLLLHRFNLASWLGGQNYNYFLDGTLFAKGKGLEPETMRTDAKGNFNNLVLYGTPIKKINFALTYDKGNVRGNIGGNGEFGVLSIRPMVNDIMGKTPRYELTLTAQDLDVSALTKDSTHKSNLNINAFVQGKSFDFEQIVATSHIDVKPSEIMTFPLNSLQADVELNRQNFLINDLSLDAFSSLLNVQGNYDMQGISDLSLDLKITDVKDIAAIFDVDSVQSSLDMKARLSGMPDDLKIDALIHLGNTVYKETMRLDSLIAEVQASITGDSIMAKANVLAEKILVSDFAIDKATVELETDTKNYDVSITAENSDMSTALKSSVEIGENIKLLLTDLMLNYQGYQWKSVADTTHITIGDNAYEVRNFTLVSNNNDSITADGKLDFSGTQDFELNITNVDLQKLKTMFGVEENFGGMLQMKLRLDGTAQSPVLDGYINLDSALYENFHFKTFKGTVAFAENVLSTNLDIVPSNMGRLYLNAKLPFVARLDSMSFDFAKGKAPVTAELIIDQIPMALLNMVFPTDDTKGYLQSNIQIAGTIEAPSLNGNINLHNGALKINKYGINYSNIQTAINFDNNVVAVDTFLIQSHDGKMEAKGNVKFASELYKGRMNTSDLQINFNRFNPFDHRQFNMEMSGKIDVKANADSTLFSGDINIPEAEVYIPAILNLMGKTSVVESPKPLLVKELEKMQLGDTVVVVRVLPDSVKKADNKLAFLNNMQGKIKLKIPRNMWIKNDEMRFELSGDLEMIKHRNFFELFGTIDVVRGQYNMLGKVFVVESGTITFQGGEKMNPILNVDAKYSFRDSERNKRELNVSVTGELESLKIAFTYEGASISEGDAVSYILFGTSMDALASGQQESLSSGLDATDLAKSAAASLLSSQLTKVLGNTLNMDYIEFRSSGSFDNASFVVGKYITNKLFVSYEQNIGNIQHDDIARYEMTMEYELFKFLFFQLTSSSLTNGFDVIFKWNSK